MGALKIIIWYVIKECLANFVISSNGLSFSPLMNDGPNSGSVANLGGSMPTAAPPSSAGMRKAWHEHVTQDLRNHLVHKL